MRACCRVSVLIYWTILFIFCQLQDGEAQEHAIHFQVVENSRTNFVVGRIHSENYTASNYSFIGFMDSCDTYFNIDPTTSVITVKDQHRLDREEMLKLGKLQDDNLACFVVVDTKDLKRITIEVLDVNDERPSFSGISQPFRTNLTENVGIPTTVVTLQPSDNDKGLNGTTHFNITRGNELDYFMISLPEGENENSTKKRDIILKKTLNFEGVTNKLFNLSITISDMGEDPLVFVQIVLITVTNLHDESPTFETTSYTFEVPENHPVGNYSEFAHVHANSERHGNSISYSISTRHTIVGVNQFTGGLFLRVPLDFEASRAKIQFSVIASNPNTRGTNIVIVNVMTSDVNDEPPYFVCKPPGQVGCKANVNLNGTEFYIRENHEYRKLLLALEVSDRDVSEEFTNINLTNVAYHLEPKDAPLQIRKIMTSSTNFFIAIFLNGTVDRELFPIIILTLAVENTAIPTLRTNSTITIRVLDVNDNAPVFAQERYLHRVFEGSPVGREILQVEAYDKDLSENGTVSYSISAVEKVEAVGWFHITPGDGRISVASSYISYYAIDGIVNLTVTATDNGTDHLSSSVNVVITVIPSITFGYNSYQEFSSEDFNLLTNNNFSVYLEYRTTNQDGLLLYQQDSNSNSFSVQLQQGNLLVVKSAANEVKMTVDDSTKDVWLAVSIQMSQQQITSLEVGSLDSSNLLLQELVLQITVCVLETQIVCLMGSFKKHNYQTTEWEQEYYIHDFGCLLGSTLAFKLWFGNFCVLRTRGGSDTAWTMTEEGSPRPPSQCANKAFGGGQELIHDHQNSLYIGGVNIFHLQPNSSLQTDTFMGSIRNVVVRGVQLDLTCPADQINTIQGVVRSHSCAEINCSSHRSSMCVDYAVKSYCQCLGGFSSHACNISNIRAEEISYAPIRFKGTTNVKLNLEYPFFRDLFQQGRKSILTPGDGNTRSGLGTGVDGEERRRRNVLDVELGEVIQVLEVQFRALQLHDSIILNSQTASSVHVVEILENSNGNSYLAYTIKLMDHLDPFILSDIRIPLVNKTLYHFTATFTTRYIILDLSDGLRSKTSKEEWRPNRVSLFAEEPQTAISIGGGPLDPHVTRNTGYFTGCISSVSIDGIEFPLTGLLLTSMDKGGFEVDNIGGVDRFCDLCGPSRCPNLTHCISDVYGGVSCQCSAPHVLENDTCVVPSSMLVSDGVTMVQEINTFIIIAGSVGGAIILLGVVVIVVIVVIRKREVKMKARLYSINQKKSHTNSDSNAMSSNSYASNTLKRRTSLTSSINCPSESHERRSSVSTFQEHAEDRDTENDIPLHHTWVRRKSGMSVESGIMKDNDMSVCGRDVMQRREVSSHGVNSTDSTRMYESDEIARSSYNNQPQIRPSISLKTRGPLLSSSDQHTPRTPQTPKEKKMMIPLCPPSISLSQSEYDEEEASDTETESFNTRVSSSSGIGGAMQNQGQGSVTSENAKTKMSVCSTPQWYHDSTMSDSEKEKLCMQTPQPYYPQPHLDVNVHPRPPGKQPPPTYPLPPIFAKHMDKNYSKDQHSRSMHKGTASSVTTSAVGTDLAKFERSYPQQFTINKEVKSNGFMYDQGGQEMGYMGCPYHHRQLSDPRILEESEYTPSSIFVRQYSDPKIPRNGTYCIPRKHREPWSKFNHQISDPRQSSQQTQDSTVYPREAHSMRYMNIYPSNSTTSTSSRHAAGGEHRQYYTLGCMVPRHHDYAVYQQKAAHSFGNKDAAESNETYHTLNSLSRIDPISNWDAQERMKIAIDHMDPCHLLSGPCIPFEYVSTDPSIIESQTTMDEHQALESQGGEGIAEMLNPLKINMARLREEELDSILTNSEIGQQIMNHFPSADCSSQYTATIIAGSTSTSGESTPKLQKVFILSPSQQSFDV